MRTTATLTKQDCAPPLAAKLAPWMERLIEDGSHSDDSHAFNWVSEFGSPLHVVVGSEFKRNVKDLIGALKTRGVDGSLHFARKANKLPLFVELARDEGIGVDTASLQEVKETLELGVAPEKVVITAIGKTRALVELAVQAGCLLISDNEDELDLIEAVCASGGKTARIGIRFAGFETDGRAVFSRFGFPVADAQRIIDRLKQSGSLKLEILHAHLDKYDTRERAIAARKLLELADLSRSEGHPVAGIDLGGGILMRYLDSKEQWNDFRLALKESIEGSRPRFTYQGDGLGFVKVGNELTGQPDLYPAFNELSKERFIAAVLDHTQNGVPLYKEFQDRKLRLFFEPGRALLDNTGITLSRVAFRKRDTLGNLLIGLEMNRMNLRPFRAEFCSDPILLIKEGANRPRPAEGAFLVGCLCSESDTIFRRRLNLEYLPVPGDVMLFANTAGYLAHHLEVGSHGNPLPINLQVDPNTWAIEKRY